MIVNLCMNNATEKKLFDNNVLVALKHILHKNAYNDTKSIHHAYAALYNISIHYTNSVLDLKIRHLIENHYSNIPSIDIYDLKSRLNKKHAKRIIQSTLLKILKTRTNKNI